MERLPGSEGSLARQAERGFDPGRREAERRPLPSKSSPTRAIAGSPMTSAMLARSCAVASGSSRPSPFSAPPARSPTASASPTFASSCAPMVASWRHGVLRSRCPGPGVEQNADSAALAAESRPCPRPSVTRLVASLAEMLSRRLRVRFDGEAAGFEVSLSAARATEAEGAMPSALGLVAGSRGRSRAALARSASSPRGRFRR